MSNLVITSTINKWLKYKYKELESLVDGTMTRMLLIGTLLLLAFLAVMFIIQTYDICPFGIEIGDRFLSIVPMALMAWAIFTMFPINGWATYLRCHKKEPLLTNSVVIAILCCLSTVIVGNFYGLLGMTIGFALLRFVSLTWIYSIYKKKKNEWHAS